MKTAFAKIPSVMRLVLLMGCAAAMPGCQSVRENGARPANAELQRDLSDSEDLVRRYEARYGKLLRERPTHDFRKLRAQLKGKPMSGVRALLGKPGAVYTMGSSESWEYTNIAYDPASGRTVRRLEVWFAKGVVDHLKAVF